MILGRDEPTQMKGTPVWDQNQWTFCLHLCVCNCALATDCIAVIRNAEGRHSEEERLAAFDELELLVESVDNASNMERMKLWPAVFACLAAEEQIDVVRFALWIIGTCAQNNPDTQRALQEHHDVIARLLTVWRDEQRDVLRIRAKILYCLIALLSNNPTGLEQFVGQSGFRAIDDYGVTGDASLEEKMRFLLTMLNGEIGREAVQCLLCDSPALLLLHRAVSEE